MSDDPRPATDSGIPVERVYGPDSSDHVLRDAPGQPGEFPFTRGIHRTMYRGRPWTMRQYAGFGTAAETNRRYRYLLDTGTTGLSVAFDLPTQMGYDSDDPMAAGEVGRVGVAIDSIEDMHRLFEGIPLEEVSTSMTINSTAAILLALYVALADERGVPRAQLAGTVQNDILKEYIARGTHIYPAEPSLRLVSNVIAFCSRELPRWNPVSISGYHIREAGSTAPQEVAEGQGLLIVEAMKMENELRARAPGRVRRVHVAAGESVKRGDVLIEFDRDAGHNGARDGRDQSPHDSGGEPEP